MRSKLLECACSCAVAIGLVGVTEAARSQVIFNNFGPADAYNTTQGLSVSGSTSGAGIAFAFAAPFTVTGPSTHLGSIDVAFNNISGTSSGVGSILTNAAGLPGTEIESFTINAGGLFGTAAPVVHMTSVLQPLLLDGSTYWIMLTPTSLASDGWNKWNLNSTGDLGVRMVSVSGGAWISSGVTDQMAFRVNGPSVTTPEPAGILLFAFGGLAVVGGLRMRKGKK